MEVVNNNEQPEVVTNEQKLQYENQQLKAVIDRCKSQMEQMNMVNVFKRLEFLFKVIENKAAFSDSFVASCVEEIEGRMTLEEDTEEPNNDSIPEEDA